MNRSTKQLRNKSVQLVKVARGKEGMEEYTWELELDMKKNYPELFADKEFCGQNSF